MAVTIPYQQDLPKRPRPIIVIGAGGIVRDAHLPAYKKAGFEIFGITDVVRAKAEKLASAFNIPNVFSSVEDAVKRAPSDVVFDVALVPNQFLKVLNQLPDRAVVLLQKPFGESRQETAAIYDLCKKKQLITAVNFQLRFAPFVMAARYLTESGMIGTIYDMEVRLTTHTPWEIFPGLVEKERLEILYHSIHYLDLIRSFLGEPESIFAKSFGHPLKSFSTTRSTILLDYGSAVRAVVNTNHDHAFGPENQESFIKWEGTKGAIKAKMGVLLDYPHGAADQFEYCVLEVGKKPEWQKTEMETSWFPDAFIGSMTHLMRYAEGSVSHLQIGIDDAIKTMMLVEAAYESGERKK